MTTETKNPWDEEPTPLCEKAAMDGYYWTDQGSRVELFPDDYERASNGEVVFIDFAQDLERRLRRSLKLVDSLRIDVMHGTHGSDWDIDPEALELSLLEIEEVLTP